MIRRPGRAIKIGLAVTLAGSLTAGATVTPVSAINKKERELHRRVNRARANNGLRPLRLSKWLSRRANNHSARMAQQRRLFHHSCLSCMFSGRTWRQLGENVGAGRTVKQVHRRFLSGSGHRRNVLGPRYRRVGLGVVRSGGRVWITQIFWG